MAGLWASCGWSMAVSYTHLDVYKRQTPENAYGLRGDYTILTMYQAEAIEAQEALSNIKIHE